MTELKFGLDESTITKINSVFRKYATIEKVLVYGSRAKGNFKPTSDIDLTLFSSSLDLSGLFKIENELDDLLLPYKIDLSLYAQLDNENLKDHIQRIGLIFYAAQDLKS
ncbi:MAG: nucleotidyltransferase domain-containing protein [Bdellovibrio sp.]|nr:nucleotidyltransferase domain-containing protein [Bdellovibrio sp.]